jgi:hypothetical protein
MHEINRLVLSLFNSAGLPAGKNKTSRHLAGRFVLLEENMF